MRWFAIFLFVIAGDAGVEQALTSSQFKFDCTGIEGVYALKALYLCQTDKKFGTCGSLAGYIANRPLTAKAIDEAKSLIAKARTQTIAMPKDHSISSLKAMEKGLFSLDAEDLLLMAVPAVGWGAAAVKTISMAAQQVGLKMVSPTACQEVADQYINADSAHNCRVLVNEINANTFEFLNSSEERIKEGLKIPKVCSHYINRLEAQIRRSMYAGLHCDGHRLVSAVGRGEERIERSVEFDDSGAITKIELRFEKEKGMSSSFVFENGAPVRVVSSTDATAERSGRRRYSGPITRITPRDRAFSELARLKTETSEMIACCRMQSGADGSRCGAAFDSVRDVPVGISAPDAVQ